MTVKIELTDDEAEWLAACMGLVMQVARHWDDRTANDQANRIWAKISLAIGEGAAGMNPDEWILTRRETGPHAP